MKESATALTPRALGCGNYGLGGGAQKPNPQEKGDTADVAGNIAPTAAASRREAELKLAIYAPVDKLVVHGWKVTDSHIIFFAKTR